MGARRNATAVIPWLALLLALVVAQQSTISPYIDVKPMPFQHLGPKFVRDGQVEGIPNKPVSGAISVVLPHPNDANILYVASPNGGIWKTTNAKSSNPQWKPLLDNVVGLSAMSIASMNFDYTDQTYNTIVASVGKWSSFAFLGALPGGILRTTNGGQSWVFSTPEQLFNVDIMGISAADNVVIACGLKNNFTLKFSSAGIYKSVDFGATFSSIPAVAGRCRDLVNDPLNPTHFYASFLGNEGIFSSVDSGDTWQQMIPDLIQTTTFSDLKAPNARLSLHSTANSRVLWALLPGLSVLPTDVMILRGEYNFLGGTWSFSPLGSVPFTNDSVDGDGLFPGFNLRVSKALKLMEKGATQEEIAGAQGAIHGSIVAHPTDPAIVFVGGDRQNYNAWNNTWPNEIGAMDYTGRLFMCATTGPCSPITHSFTANNSAPHADSRSMRFDADGHIIEGDDGGVYKRWSPTSTSGVWTSLIGDLVAFESHSVAWSPYGYAITGNQDTGTTAALDLSDPNAPWKSIFTGDGGETHAWYNSTHTTAYISYQRMGYFSQLVFEHASNELVAFNIKEMLLDSLSLTDYASFLQSYSINKFNPEHLFAPIAVGLDSLLVFSDDGGDVWGFSVPNMDGSSGLPKSIAYGVRLDGVDFPEVALFHSARHIFLFNRTSESLLGFLGTYPPAALTPTSSVIVSVYVDPDEAYNMTVLSLQGDVSVTSDYATFKLISPRLQVGNSSDYSSYLHDQSQIIRLNTAMYDSFIVASGGLYQLRIGHPRQTKGWSRLGGPNLPSVVISNMEYFKHEDTLLIGTMGRGLLKLTNVTDRFSVSLFAPEDSPPATIFYDQLGAIDLHGVFPAEFTLDSVWFDLGGSCDAPIVHANRSMISCAAPMLTSPGPLYTQVKMSRGSVKDIESERILIATIVPRFDQLPAAPISMTLNATNLALALAGNGYVVSNPGDNVGIFTDGPGCSCAGNAETTWTNLMCQVDASKCIAGSYSVKLRIKSQSVNFQNPEKSAYFESQLFQVNLEPSVANETSRTVLVETTSITIHGYGFDPKTANVTFLNESSSVECILNREQSTSTELVCALSAPLQSLGPLMANVTAATGFEPLLAGVATVVLPPPVQPPHESPQAAPSMVDATSPQQASPNTSGNSNSSTSLEPGAIAGIVIAIIVAVAAVIAVTVLVLRSRSQQTGSSSVEMGRVGN